MSTTAHVLSPATFATLCGQSDGDDFVYGGIDDAYRALLFGSRLPGICEECAKQIGFVFTNDGQSALRQHLAAVAVQ